MNTEITSTIKHTFLTSCEVDWLANYDQSQERINLTYSRTP